MKQYHSAIEEATMLSPITAWDAESSPIAVLDPDFWTRRQMGRAIRRLGYWPIAFTSQLKLIRSCRNLEPRLEAVVVACPGDVGAAGALIARLREQLGPDCPLVMSAGKCGIRELAVLYAHASDCVEVTPSSFEEAYLLVRSFLQRRRAPIADMWIEWGAFRFDLSLGSAEVAGAPVKLTPNEFDLAIEFFKNLDQVLTYRRLRLAVWENGYSSGSRVLASHVFGLRHKLGLEAGRHGLELQALLGRGYRLSSATASASGTLSPANEHMPGSSATATCRPSTC